MDFGIEPNFIWIEFVFNVIWESVDDIYEKY